MKIAIYTQPLLNNYGGYLQNYALQKVLHRMGMDAFTLNIAFKKTPWWMYLCSWTKSLLYLCIPGRKRKFAKIQKTEKRKSAFDDFISSKICLTKKLKSPLMMSKEMNSANAFVVGSDQVWRPKYAPCLQNAFLDFVTSCEIKKISYAASFGVDKWEYPDKQTAKCSILAKKFNAISVREKSGVKLCKDHLGVDATWVLDPTLLLKKEDYLKLCQDVSVNNSRFMAVYVLNMNDSVRDTYESLAKEKNLEIKFFAADANATLSVPEWIAMFRDASYVVTDSFHGTVFSIIFEKEFKCIYNETRGAARFESLLNLYNSGKLEEMREFSLNWLKNALES